MKAYVTFLVVVENLPDDIDDEEIVSLAKDYDYFTVIDIDKEFTTKTQEELDEFGLHSPREK